MINQHINLGEINTLKINRETENGYYLQADDEEEVLLPNAYITEEMKIGDIVEVFIYTDSEDRLVATTERPYAMKDQFAFVEVVSTMPYGSFVDWGLPKDLFVPRTKQKNRFKEGDKRIIRIVKDVETSRLIGVEKITSFLSNKTHYLDKGQEVDLLIFARTPLGYKAIIDNVFEGMLYDNELFTKVSVGDTLKGYVKNIRADKKVDLSLQPIGKEKAADLDSEKILDLLKQNDGEIPYNYKSDAEIIKEVFGISKKAYKRALTSLVEAKKIEVIEEGMKAI
jgi:predicted RNA-binding protein (virulence factor B family)